VPLQQLGYRAIRFLQSGDWCEIGPHDIKENEFTLNIGDAPIAERQSFISCRATMETGWKNHAGTITAWTGDNTIALKKSGYAPWERKIHVTGGKIQISGELQASEATETRPAESLSQIVSAVMTHR
jgi:hypothetical protein